MYQPILVWIFGVYLNHTFFESLICPASRKHARRWCEQEVTEIMSGCHPSYLKTVSQQMVSRIRTHSLRFLTPNTAVLVGIIQIHNNFGCLKWLHTKKIYIWDTIRLFKKPLVIHPISRESDIKQLEPYLAIKCKTLSRLKRNHNSFIMCGREISTILNV